MDKISKWKACILLHDQNFRSFFILLLHGMQVYCSSKCHDIYHRTLQEIGDHKKQKLKMKSITGVGIGGRRKEMDKRERTGDHTCWWSFRSMAGRRRDGQTTMHAGLGMR